MRQSSIEQKSFRRRLTLTLVLPPVLMMALAGVLLWQIHHLLALEQQVSDRNVAITQIHEMEKLLADLRTSLRGYLNTGNSGVLEPYNQGISSIDSAFDNLNRLLAENPEQLGRLKELRDKSMQWQAYARERIASKEAGGNPEGSSRTAGRGLMDEMRAINASMLKAEEILRDAHARSAERSRKIVIGTSVGLTLLLGGLLALFAWRQIVAVSRYYDRALAVAGEQTKALRTSGAFLRKVLDTAPSPIFVKDWDGKYTLANQALADVYETTVDNLIGKTDRDFNLNEADVTRFAEQDRDVMLTMQQHFIEEEPVINPKTSEVMWFQKTKVPLLSSDGQCREILGIASEITQRKRAEEALGHTQAQFLQAQKLEVVGRLAGGIAHDFNNLLTAIGGYSDLSLRGLGPDDPLRSNLEEIKGASDRAASLTRQLLAFSRKQVMQPKVFDLNSVVANTERLLRQMIGEDIELKTILQPDLGNVKADPGQMEQVIMNLVVNARDAMPSVGKLTIETANTELDEIYAQKHFAIMPGAYVTLAVSDNGIGMDEATQQHIFEPFFTTKEPGKGTGLGLSTVYGIVEQSGGKINVYSEVGKGTMFKIYLPRVHEDVQKYQSVAEVADLPMGTETILLVEDAEIVRNLTRKVLETSGYRVLEANSPGAALRICEEYQGAIDLLLTDVVMPDMSGRELANRLAAMRPSMQVLYMSGYTEDAIIHHGVLQEGINFIQKPFSPGELAQKVREVLRFGRPETGANTPAKVERIELYS